jgi:DNA helicase II / ATP-dependent DNA helicase PcrA
MPLPESPAQSLVAPIEALRQGLRPGQREIADWTHGRLAVSAVPGAGKSTGMAVAAAIAIVQNQLHTRHQLLVVTFTRSAVANLKVKIRANLKALGRSNGGFTVQTLHGLAWSIARAYPEVAGIDPDAVLITANQSHRLIRNTVERWINGNPLLYQGLLAGQSFDGEETERLRRQSVLRTEVLPALAATVIHEAKSSGLGPDDLLEQSHFVNDDYQILAIAAGLYEQYQEQLQLRNYIDYDEMILAALRVLENPEIRQKWQQQFFAIFEDEAQDSSPLQTKLLEILAIDPTNTNNQNLVRVGDPNQAINSTFTPADPVYFREFCQTCAKEDALAEMNQAGRSSAAIITAANFMLEWTNAQWSKRSTGLNFGALSEAPFRSQLIQPVGENDPQPDANPTGAGLEIHIPEDTDQTVEKIGQRAIDLFKLNPAGQAAVLVRTNDQGKFVVQELRRWYGDRLVLFEVGESDRRSHIPAQMLALLQFIDRPHSPDYLKAALTVLIERRRIPTQDLNTLVTFPEQFLYPVVLDPPLNEAARSASRLCTSLLRARSELPTHQLIPFLAYTLDYDQSELATADKLADRISQESIGNSLTDLLPVLSEIVSSEGFEPVDAADSADKYTKPGQLTIITMHKAKGLDWDYVFIPFLHDHVIPGNLYVPQQAQFIGQFSLAEVARAQIRAGVHHQPIPDIPTAWDRAGALKTAEEFRLLYVAMTRAKRLLWMSAALQAPFTWNKPEDLQHRKPCPLIPALMQQFPRSVVSNDDDDNVDF